MRRMLALIIVTIMLIACGGCLWEVDRDGHGDRDRGGHGDHDQGWHGEHEERR